MRLHDIPPGLEKKANEQLEEFSLSVQTIQPGYLQAHGVNFQGIISSAVPEDGQEIQTDKSRKPTDQAQDYDDVGVRFPLKSILAFGCDVYGMGENQGYIVFGEIRVAQRLWRRQIDYGPSGRTHGWNDITIAEGLI